MLASYNDSYTASTSGSGVGTPNYKPPVKGNEYQLNTLYIKREWEQMPPNTICGLNEFDNENVLFRHKTNYRGDREFIFQDITGDDENYAPVTTKTETCINQNDTGVQLKISYRNSHSLNNQIIINVKHRIRSNNCSGDSASTSWAEVKAVQSLDIGNINSGTLNKIYNKQNQGYFFVKNGY